MKGNSCSALLSFGLLFECSCCESGKRLKCNIDFVSVFLCSDLVNLEIDSTVKGERKYLHAI